MVFRFRKGVVENKTGSEKVSEVNSEEKGCEGLQEQGALAR